LISSPDWRKYLGSPTKRVGALLPSWQKSQAESEREKKRPELEQALIRVVIAFIVMVYLFWYAFRSSLAPALTIAEHQVLAVSIGFFLFSGALALQILRKGGTSIPRRYLAMVADNVVTTYCLMNMGEGGAVVIGVYLFITFGNGFRYGRVYLHVCQVMGIAGFSLVLAFSNFWSQHIAIGVGFLIGLVVLPFYVGVLAERIEKAKRRADDANQAKGRFVAHVSHEMRTPLNGVIAMADILRETTLSDSQLEIVETMTTSAQLLLAQIEDVLDMAKIDSGRIQIESRPVDLARLLSSIVKVVLPQARYKGITVNTDVAPDAAGWFLGDAHHLRQVILNLLSNAVKFTETGSVTLRAKAVENGEKETLLRFEVQDTGIGIPAEKQTAIFEPFAQADESITRKYGGTGLGTTIARHLVGLMGGRIGLVSEVNVGSTFWFELSLPIAERQGIDLTEELTHSARLGSNAQAIDAIRSGKIHKLRGARVLVADDNSTNQRVAQLILESGGHTVTLVENGEEALDALERGSFDIALFDLSMPIFSGLEALKLYRFTARHPIPILMLSANVTTDVMAECEKAGAAEFIPKPLRASHLLDAIERQLATQAEQRVAVSPPIKTEERIQFSVVDTPPVDQEVLNDLARISTDPTFVERLIVGFHSDTRRLIDEIIEAISQRRYEEVKDIAHALKGGAASVGATQLTQLARRIEKAGHDSLRLKAAQWIEELQQTSQRALNELDQRIKLVPLDRAVPRTGA
jgi:two-component system sensor histidine kinase RpfC